MSAGNIASHGRINKASALTVGSFGRLERVRAVLEVLRVEIMRITSTINRIITGDSTI